MPAVSPKKKETEIKIQIRTKNKKPDKRRTRTNSPVKKSPSSTEFVVSSKTIGTVTKWLTVNTLVSLLLRWLAGVVVNCPRCPRWFPLDLVCARRSRGKITYVRMFAKLSVEKTSVDFMPLNIARTASNNNMSLKVEIWMKATISFHSKNTSKNPWKDKKSSIWMLGDKIPCSETFWAQDWFT